MPGASLTLHPFSPWQGRPEQLLRTLVGRRDILRDILAGIASTTERSSANHVLLVGQRGVGKTHLLCLVNYLLAHQIQHPPDLPCADRGWIPVLFVEEEFAGLNSLASFLLSVVEKLREAEPLSNCWDVAAEVLQQDDDTVCDWCFDRFETWHHESGQRLVLLIDNLQRILPVWSDHDQQRLRAFMSGRDWVLVLGTTPTIFREVLGQRAALHDFFEVVHLKELGSGEVLELIAALYREDGRAEEFAKRRAELESLLPPILALTGGNPRLVLFLYEVLVRSRILQIEGALSRLLEELREYFLGRFDALPPQSRKVLDTLAQMPGPARPGEIAGKARLSAQLVNAQLRRLREQNYVYRIKLKSGRETRYDITERLFRIWRQTATVAGRRRFRFLVRFLRLFYSKEQIRPPVEQPISRQLDLYPEERIQVIRLAEGPGRLDEALDVLTQAGRRGVPASDLHHIRGDILLLAGRYEEAEAAYDTALVEQPDWPQVQGNRLVARACAGRLGPMMEALPGALDDLEADTTTTETDRDDFLLSLAARCLERDQFELALGLFRSVLLLKSSNVGEIGGDRLLLFLRSTLESAPQQLQRMVHLLLELAVKRDVELLEPFVDAVRLVETRDLGILEQLFPEVAEIVQQIAIRIEPDLDSLVPQ